MLSYPWNSRSFLSCLSRYDCRYIAPCLFLPTFFQLIFFRSGERRLERELVLCLSWTHRTLVKRAKVVVLEAHWPASLAYADKHQASEGLCLKNKQKSACCPSIRTHTYVWMLNTPGKKQKTKNKCSSTCDPRAAQR